jgi:uncharacterized protein (TIGR03066 family)
MKKIVLAVAVLLLSVVLTAWAEEGKGKENKEDKGVQVTVAKLVGVWMPVNGKLPAGTSVLVEFSKDGKLKVYGKTKFKGEDADFSTEATYKIVPGGIAVAGRRSKGEVETHPITITRLTYQEMVIRNEQGVEGVFKKR